MWAHNNFFEYVNIDVDEDFRGSNNVFSGSEATGRGENAIVGEPQFFPGTAELLPGSPGHREGVTLREFPVDGLGQPFTEPRNVGPLAAP